jgi:hypothetical protein
LIGSIRIRKQGKSFLSPTMLVVGGVMTLFSPIALVVSLLSMGTPLHDVHFSFGYWRALIAGILSFILLKKRPSEAEQVPPHQ